MYECMFVCVHVFSCVLQHFGLVHAIQTGNKRSEPDPDSCSPWSRYTGDSKTDPLDDPNIPTVRALETRRLFGFKTASFHVSVCSCIIFLFLVVNIIYMLPVSFYLTV